jgi:hypothetical protein
MDIVELTAEEDVVLFGFLREVIRADGKYSAAERKEVVALTEKLGMARTTRGMEEAALRFPTTAKLKEAAKAITRPEARLAIIGFLETVAAVDMVTPDEDRPLKWLASWWDIAR